MDTATNNTLLLLTVDKQKFQDLLKTVPTIKHYYEERAKARRLEFKRLMKKFYIEFENKNLF
jgi:hypothetical protein